MDSGSDAVSMDHMAGLLLVFVPMARSVYI